MDFMTAIGAGKAIGSVFGGRKARKRAQGDWQHQWDQMRTYDINKMNQQRYWQTEDILREHYRQDREIQRRMADAKAAGIHPLVAMGMSPTGAVVGSPPSGGVPSMPPIGQSASGSHVGDAISEVAGLLDPQAKRQRQLSTDLMEAQLENTRAATVATLANASRGAAGPTPVGQGPDKREERTRVLYTDEEGNKGNVVVGPDIGEMIGGALAELITRWQNAPKLFREVYEKDLPKLKPRPVKKRGASIRW